MMLGAVYLVVMLIGSRLMESPPPGWKPAGLDAAGEDASDDRRRAA